MARKRGLGTKKGYIGAKGHVVPKGKNKGGHVRRFTSKRGGY